MTIRPHIISLFLSPRNVACSLLGLLLVSLSVARMGEGVFEMIRVTCLQCLLLMPLVFTVVPFPDQCHFLHFPYFTPFTNVHELASFPVLLERGFYSIPSLCTYCVVVLCIYHTPGFRTSFLFHSIRPWAKTRLLLALLLLCPTREHGE